MAASLGCGNPTALAQLEPGETVLDLGSGGGIDVLLSARRVGPTGKAYGLDMTDEMLALARENQKKAGLANVEFLKGEIEAIPLPDDRVDVIISNCVINLSADKDRVLTEAFRVLKPGGRFAVSDVVVRGEVPPDIRRSVELWIGCVAGALEERRVPVPSSPSRRLRGDRGGADAGLQAWRTPASSSPARGSTPTAIAPQVDGKFMSAFIRARKPSPLGGTSQAKSAVAAAAPTSWAMMKPGASAGRIPAKVSLAERAMRDGGIGEGRGGGEPVGGGDVAAHGVGNGGARRRLQPQITARSPKVATNSLKSWAPPARTFCEAKKRGSSNITLAAATPARAPTTWAAR